MVTSECFMFWFVLYLNALTCSSFIYFFLLKYTFSYGLKPTFIISEPYLYEELGISLTYLFCGGEGA